MMKEDAIYTIINDARSRRRSTRASLKWLNEALTVLGLQPSERRKVLSTLDHINYETGEPYAESAKLLKRDWMET